MDDRFIAVSIDLLCFLDFDGDFRKSNPAWERALGFTRAERMPRPFIDFVHPDDRERTLNQNRAVRTGGQAPGVQIRSLCKDGWFRWNAASDSAERLIYSVARDMTEGKRAEEERDRLVAELPQALAEVRTLCEFLPTCSYCKCIRDDRNYWPSVEAYVLEHTNTRFSHGICPGCFEMEVAPQLRAAEALANGEHRPSPG